MVDVVDKEKKEAISVCYSVEDLAQCLPTFERI